MPLKRIIPILVLLALVIGLAACQSDTANEAVEATPADSITKTEQTADAGDSAPTEAEPEEAVAKADAAPAQVVETEAAAA